MKTILAAVDFSPVSTHVADAACRLARELRARVVLLHVEQPPPSILRDQAALDGLPVAELIAAGRKVIMREMTKLKAHCGGTRARLSVRSVRGKPRTAIVAHARKLRAKYIVMGSHGHSAAYDLLVGSVAQAVLRKAPCPVLIIPPPTRR
jgi:nucleotide-binding universal stress UspA family protein